jgi:hypothetical protein
MSVPDFVEQPFKKMSENCDNPYAFYKLFVDDDFVNNVYPSNLFTGRKGRPEAQPKLNSNNTRIMHITGYITPSHWSMYCEKINTLVKNTMS